MANYKISDLENLSGIKAHTIRIWEQRYGVLTPIRSNSSIRYYDDAQLKKLLNIVTLLNAGNKISHISKLSDIEINEKLMLLGETSSNDIKEELLINQLIASGLSFDEKMFEKAFSNSILSFGVQDSYRKVLYPLLHRIGLLWTTNDMNPSQEHFISNLIRQKMFAAIDSLNIVGDAGEKWLLFLPQNENHELGLLVANYILRSNNNDVCYLGANVPLENIVEVANKVKPTHFLTFIVKANQAEIANSLFKKMSVDLNNPSLYVCCDRKLSDSLVLTKNQSVVNSFDGFLSVVSKPS